MCINYRILPALCLSYAYVRWLKPRPLPDCNSGKLILLLQLSSRFGYIVPLIVFTSSWVFNLQMMVNPFLRINFSRHFPFITLSADEFELDGYFEDMGESTDNEFDNVDDTHSIVSSNSDISSDFSVTELEGMERALDEMINNHSTNTRADEMEELSKAFEEMVREVPMDTKGYDVKELSQALKGMLEKDPKDDGLDEKERVIEEIVTKRYMDNRANQLEEWSMAFDEMVSEVAMITKGYDVEELTKELKAQYGKDKNDKEDELKEMYKVLEDMTNNDSKDTKDGSKDTKDDSKDTKNDSKDD